MKTHLFVLCPPYSGSTLLWKLLATSENVSSLPDEGQFLPEVKSVMREAPWDVSIKLPWARIKEVWYKYWDMDKEILLEKSPPNLIRTQEIIDHFRPVKFLIMVRNPYAHCEGLMRRNGWDAQSSAEFSIRCLRYQMENAINLQDSIYFTYEELVGSPALVSSRIQDFLPEIGMLKYETSFKVHSIDGLVEQKIVDFNPKKLDRLSLEDLAKINNVLIAAPDVMNFWGYEYMNYPKAAIIMLTHNSLYKTTKPCLDSIINCKTDIDYRLVVVDNFSTDGTREYLSEQAISNTKITVIINNENYGYAKGNNIGINSIFADYYILLNNDTVVTDYWLDKLVSFLQKHENVGLLGPVSNSVGCEQKVYFSSDSEVEIMKDGLKWVEMCSGDFFYPHTLGFFCVVIPRKVIDKVGLLDESYGLGMFEDYDYCHRVKRAGYDISCMEDVFVYHKGSVSFKSANIDLGKVFIENMNLFETKHRVNWRSGHSVEPFVKLLQKYVNDLNPDNIDKVAAKIRNKLAVMESMGFSDVYRDFIKTQEKLQRASGSTPLPSAEQELYRIRSSLTWKVASRIHRVIDRFMTKRPRKPEPTVIDRDRVELARILSRHPSKPVMISFPSHEWNVPLFQRWQQMAINISRHGILYFFCSCNVTYDHYSGFHQMSDSCYVTNRFDLLEELQGMKIFHEYSTDIGTPIQKIEDLLCKGNLIVYEYFDELHDDLFNFKIPKHALIKHAEILKDTRCIIVTTADKLTDDVKRYRNDYIVQAENGVDYDHFSQVINQLDIPEEIQRIMSRSKPIVGYFGAFASWFDYELVIELATKRPEYELLLIGLNYDKTLDAYDFSGFDNVTILDFVNYIDLPRYAHCFSAAIIPFRLNCLTEATSPIKMFEYMALGHPIVTTGLRECRKYTSVMVAEDSTDFINKVDQAIILKADPDFTALLNKEALENSWISKARLVADAIKGRIESTDITSV